MTDLIDTVLREMTTVLARVSRDEVGALADRLNAAQRVFVAGGGGPASWRRPSRCG